MSGFAHRSTQLEIPDREKRGIERKGNFIIDLRCYQLFHCTVGPIYDPSLKREVDADRDIEF